MKRDDLYPQWEGLGKKVEKPAKPADDWHPDPDANPDKCIEIGPDGKRRTNDPRNQGGL